MCDDGYKNLKLLEANSIHHWQQIAVRKGNTLTIKVGKASIPFIDVGQSGMENSKHFRFVYYFSQFDVAVVHQGENTLDTFLLVTDSDTIELMGLPIFSKSGQRAFSFLSCEMNGNWFSIVNFKKGSLTEELSWSSEDFRKMGFVAFEDPEWVATDSIEILTKNILKDGVQVWSPMKTILTFNDSIGKWNRKTIPDDTISIESDH